MTPEITLVTTDEYLAAILAHQRTPFDMSTICTECELTNGVDRAPSSSIPSICQQDLDGLSHCEGIIVERTIALLSLTYAEAFADILRAA